ISDKWQKWLELISRLPRTAIIDTDEKSNPVPISIQISRAMVRIFGANQSFRSKEQETAMLQIVRGVSPLVVVFPTGAGKTLLIQIPALLEGAKSTIVIVPLIALAQDLLSRCKEINLDSIIWNKNRNRISRIVIVVAETATSKEFAEYALGLYLRRELDRIFIDEAHKLITDLNYRPKLRELRRLVLPVPLIYLSATFPPSIERQFEQQNLLTNATYLRTSTNRISTMYEVRICPDNVLQDQVRNFVSVAREKSGSKIIIFCPSKNLCDTLAKMLNCGTYYSRENPRLDHLEAFKSGMTDLIVATGALGAGINVSQVHWILHIGIPYGAIDYVQESGRAGRAGETVTSVILLGRSTYEKLEMENPTLMSDDKRVIRDFILTEGCVRKILGEYMDGNGMDCEELTAERCYRCKISYEGTQEGRKRKRLSNTEVESAKRIRNYESRRESLWEEDQAEALQKVYLEETIETLKR